MGLYYGCLQLQSRRSRSRRSGHQVAAGLFMHRNHLREVLRDAAVADAIRPAIERGGLTFVQARDALIALKIPRAACVAAIACSESGR